jgi:hypothetical protein
MVIIIDKITKKDKSIQFHHKYPDGNIPGLTCAENEEIIRIMDGSELSQKILSAHEYEKIFDGGNLVDVTIIKTKEQHNVEQAELHKNERRKNEILAELRELDFQISRIIEDNQDRLFIHASKLDIITQKQALREQLKLLV